MNPPRSSFGRAALLLLSLLAATWLCDPGRAKAETAGRVLIVTTPDRNALLEEGLVRVRGELAAMGLSTETRADGEPTRTQPSPEYQGALVFERFGTWLRIQAWNPEAPMPVTQWIDASDPAVDAEVVAVRAVEALRAALLPYARSRQEEPPASAPPDRRAAPRATTPEPPTPDRPERPPPATAARPRGELRLGPSAGVDAGASALHLGAQAGVAYGGRWLSAGARLEITRAGVPVDDAAGEVRVMRVAALLDGRARLALDTNWDLFAAVGGGVVHHRVEGIAAPGFTGQTGEHASLALSLELGSAYWLARHLAIYLGSRATLATDAPVVRVDRRPIATLERPQLALSSGVVLGLD